ncbi:MAG: UDP-N-acetylmuramoyl-tripeptide--D-alanyl-D-alanine ligase [Candidatus Aminicenantes bacterium]|nr:UDP-N-acetylmuramoyl-tripeptide--D-alanyl-D-alanine ligase [Candidatus Aminicenantes bacterium]
MAELQISEIAAVVSGRVSQAGPVRSFSDFQFDTRTMGANSLFFALQSAKADGHRFVRELATIPGAGAVVKEDFTGSEAKIPLIRVSDPLQAAQKLAIHVREKYRSVKYIGITGSAGKTTTKEFVFQILSHKFRSFRSLQNWNNGIGLPFSMLKMNGLEETAIFELAMSDPGIGEIDLLAGILKPDIAVLLNVFPVHLEFLGTLGNAARAKAEILNYLSSDGCALVNGDSALLRRTVAAKKGCKIFFGAHATQNQVVLKKVVRENGNSRMLIDFFGIEAEFVAPLVSRLHVENIFASILVAQRAGMKNHEIQEALSGLQPLAGRGQIRREKGFVIIDETYNSNPEALKKTLQWIGREYHQKKVAVLGDMLELGRGELAFHLQVGRFFADLHFDLLLTVGRRAAKIAEGARKAGYPAGHIRCFDHAVDAGKYLRAELQPEAVVLFKGSRGVSLEKALAEFVYER